MRPLDRIEINPENLNQAPEGQQSNPITEAQTELRRIGILTPDGVLAVSESAPRISSSDIENLQNMSAEISPENIFDGICKAACDVAAAGAAAALTLSGPALVAALAAIELARNACRDAC